MYSDIKNVTSFAFHVQACCIYGQNKNVAVTMDEK